MWRHSRNLLLIAALCWVAPASAEFANPDEGECHAGASQSVELVRWSARIGDHQLDGRKGNDVSRGDASELGVICKDHGALGHLHERQVRCSFGVTVGGEAVLTVEGWNTKEGRTSSVGPNRLDGARTDHGLFWNAQGSADDDHLPLASTCQLVGHRKRVRHDLQGTPDQQSS